MQGEDAMRIRQGLSLIGVLGVAMWLGAVSASAQYGPPPGGDQQMAPDDSQQDDNGPPPGPGNGPPGRPPMPRGPAGMPPPGPGGMAGFRGDDGGRFEGLRARMMQLRGACDAGDRRACIRFGILIGENRERMAQWRRQNPELFSWER